MDQELYHRLLRKRDQLAVQSNVPKVKVLLDDEIKEMVELSQDISEDEIKIYGNKNHRNERVPEWYERYGHHFWQIINGYYNPPKSSSYES